MSDLEELLASLSVAPRFPDAACKGSGHLFDARELNEGREDAADRHRRAISLCGSCVSLRECQDYLATMKSDDLPLGFVVAGQVVGQGEGISARQARRDRVEAILREDTSLSNYALGRAAGCDPKTAKVIRLELAAG